MVFDQMRPDYVDRFNLPNFRRLRAMSVNYPQAYVGHLAAETVVSHLVISSGLLPRDLPWQDEVMTDTKGVLGKAGATYLVTTLGRDQLLALMRTLPQEALLPARLRKKLGGGVYAVGVKNYGTLVFGTSTADAVVALDKTAEKKCVPWGVNVPAYISDNDRYTLDCSRDYGTAHSSSALDGAKYIPGDDPKHQGGDIWVADAALDIMSREKWSAMLLTFGGVDKFGHLLGEQDGPRPRGFTSPLSFEQALNLADQQLGRVLDDLQKRALLERTMIVLTSDHGGQGADYYLGNWTKGPWGKLANVPSATPPFWIDWLLSAAGNAAAIQATTAIRMWLDNRSSDNRARLAGVMSQVSGVVEVYALGDHNYTRTYSAVSRQPPAFRAWAEPHNQALMDSMAGPGAADVVGLLADGVGFGSIGEHGGAQERDQRIPIMVYVPGRRARQDKAPMRLVDIAPAVAEALHLD